MPRAAPASLALAALLGLAGCPDQGEQIDPGAAWSAVPALPAARLEPGVAALGQRLVVAGGWGPDLAITTRVDALDLEAGAWTALPDAPVVRTHAQLAALGATLYLLGGLEGEDAVARGDAHALDTAVPGAAWRPLAAMPAGAERGAAAIVTYPAHVVLIGGASTTGALASVVEYDAIADAWTALPDLPAPRSHPVGMRMVDGTLIVAGGLAGLTAADAAADVWALRPGATAWEPRAAMPTARGGCAAGVVLGRLVCAGGEAGASALAVVEIYDPFTDTWRAGEPLPAPRAGTQGAAVGGRLFVPGGSGSLQFAPEATTFAYAIAADVAE